MRRVLLQQALQGLLALADGLVEFLLQGFHQFLDGNDAVDPGHVGAAEGEAAFQVAFMALMRAWAMQ